MGRSIEMRLGLLVVVGEQLSKLVKPRRSFLFPIRDVLYVKNGLSY